MPINVLIAGGGPAGMEAALALHRLAGDRVATTVLAPEADFTYRPLSVLAPFAAGGAHRPTRSRASPPTPASPTSAAGWLASTPAPARCTP